MSTYYRLSAAAPLALHHTVRAPPPVRARPKQTSDNAHHDIDTSRTVHPHRPSAPPIVAALAAWGLHTAPHALKSP
jgi:hypothetical protein